MTEFDWGKFSKDVLDVEGLDLSGLDDLKKPEAVTGEILVRTDKPSSSGKRWEEVNSILKELCPEVFDQQGQPAWLMLRTENYDDSKDKFEAITAAIRFLGNGAPGTVLGLLPSIWQDRINGKVFDMILLNRIDGFSEEEIKANFSKLIETANIRLEEEGLDTLPKIKFL